MSAEVSNKLNLPACYAEIDTLALRHNYQVLKKQANGAKVLAVIKANAYGHDATIVANALPEADGFGVARLNEAVKLRNADVKNRIVVLGGILSQEDWQQCHEHTLDVVLHHSSQLKALNQFLVNFEIASKIAIWLKLDTGMHRLGFNLQELESTVHQLSELQEKLRQPIVVMSHFANADDPNDPYTSAQLNAFLSIKSHLKPLNKFEYSIANSSAVLSRDDANFAWVRVGLALYGVVATGIESRSRFDLKPVMSLRSRLIEIKQVAAGAAVGYGQVWQAKKECLIGIASIGYGHLL